MDIEKRLRQHLAEQARSIEIETADPHIVVGRAPSRPQGAVTVVVAGLLVLLAGGGFWMLSRGDDSVTEIAAGQSDGSDSASGGEADGGPFVPLEVIDITSDSSPGYGEVLVENNVYYVLSTAPGRVEVNFETMTELEQAKLFRPNSFYVFDSNNDAEWAVNEIEDRFISDFDVHDGLLYAISTGSFSDDSPAIGTSADNGRTWDWVPVGELPKVDQVTLLAGDGTSLLFAYRWGSPDYDTVLELATGAGVPVDRFTLQHFDHQGLSYLPIDSEDKCAMILGQMAPEMADMKQWLESTSGEEREMAETEYRNMLEWLAEDAAQAGCDLDLDAESIETFDVPDPVRVTWADLGVTTPETWQPWAALYTFDGERLTEVGTPFEDGFQVSYATVTDGKLEVSLYDPVINEQAAEREAETEAETVWSTSDGVAWDERIRRFDEFEGYGYNYYDPEPTVGGQSFRVWWDEFEEYEEYGEQSPQQATATTIQADQVAEATEETIEYAEDAERRAEEEMGDYVEPEPRLQRSIAGGPWENVTLADLDPTIDLGNKVIQEVRGTSLGAFLIHGDRFTGEGPPGSHVTVVYSNNGKDWATFEVDGNMEIYNTPEQLLVLAHDWSDEDGERARTSTLLVRPAG